MRDLLWLIRKTIISTFKDYKSWFVFLGLPVAAIALAFFTRGESGEIQVKIGIVNEDGDRWITQDTIDYISKMDSVFIHELVDSEISDQITSGKLDAALKFPQGFAQSVISGNPEPVQIVTIKGAEITGFIQTNLNLYIDHLLTIANASEGDATRFETLYMNDQSEQFSWSVHTVEDQSVNYSRASQSIGYLILLMLFSAANLSSILIKERENRTYHRIIASPVSPKHYVLSNILINLGVMVIQIVLTLLILTQIFRVDPGVPNWKILMLLLLFSLVAVSLSLAITAFSKSTQSANAIQNMLFIPTSVIAGCMFPIEIMPDAMQKVAVLLPQYWLLESFRELQLGNTLSSIYVNLLILAAFALTFTLLTIYKFGRNNDTRIFV